MSAAFCWSREVIRSTPIQGHGKIDSPFCREEQQHHITKRGRQKKV